VGRLVLERILPYGRLNGRLDRSLAAALALLIPLGFYVASISSFPASWDTAEMQTAPYVLGIPHAPGFPAFVLMGWLFSHVIAFGTVAWRMNFFGACAIAVAVALLYQTAVVLGAGRVAALLAVLGFAFGATAWQKASAIDVHALTLMWTAFALYFSARYVVTNERWTLVAAALACGLGMATHPNALWTIPAIAFAYATGRRRSLAHALLVVVALIAPLGLYAFEPLRSWQIAARHLDPVQSLWWPRDEIPASVIWDTNQPRTLDGFYRQVFANQSGARETLGAVLRLDRYPAYVMTWFGFAAQQAGVAGLVAALLGLIALARCNLRAAILVFTAGFAAVPFGASYGNESDVGRYFLASFAVAPVFAAFVPELFDRSRLAALVRPLGILLLLAIAADQLRDNARFLQARKGLGSQPVIDAANAEIPPHAVVLTGWINATSLAYGQDIEGALPSRIIITHGPVRYEREIAVWRRDHPIYVLADWSIGTEPGRMPAGWAVERPTVAPGHRLYEICPTARTCTQSKYAP
jgi:hypothetical protein